MNIIIDWLEGTWLGIPTNQALEIITTLCGELTDIGHGAMNYTCAAIVNGTGLVAWSPTHPEHGVHLRLPATALGAGGLEDTPGLLKYLVDTGFRASRIDLALDDKAGILDLEVISTALSDDHVVTRARWFGENTSQRRQQPEIGRTITIGRRCSETYARFYDKAIEQHHPGHWIRFELELKGKKAAAALKELAQFGSQIALGWIRAFLDFTEPGKDTNTRRWKPADWWQRFLDQVDKLRLEIIQTPMTLARIQRWLNRSVAPSLACIAMAMGEDGHKWLRDITDSGIERLSPIHKALLLKIAS